MKFITGTNGFIGRNYLARCDGDVATYDAASRTLPGVSDILEYIEWKNVEEIIHLGAISDTTCRDLDKIYEYNIDFTIKLFTKAICNKIPVKYASSASVYGNTLDWTVSPLNYYAMSKATIDMWVEDHIEDFVNVKGYRFYNVYGPNEGSKGNSASPFYKFTAQALSDGVISVFEGSDDFKRDFIHVDNVVDVLLGDQRDESGVFDVGTAEPRSFMEVASLIAQAHNAEVKVVPFPDHLKNRYQTFTKAKYSFKELLGVSVDEEASIGSSDDGDL